MKFQLYNLNLSSIVDVSNSAIESRTTIIENENTEKLSDRKLTADLKYGTIMG